jgi:AbrB family looped-hinge helix DNA binding protein
MKRYIKVGKEGRIVLPAAYRHKHDLKHGSILSVEIDGDEMVLSPNVSTCVFCGEFTHTELMGKKVCTKCYNRIHTTSILKL